MLIELIGARVKLATATATGFTGGVIAGAVTTAELDAKVYPGLHAGITATVAADCTNPQAADCGCAQGSSGRTFVNLFDVNPKDCTITLDELKTNSLIQSLLAPDVTIGGQPAVSIGYGVTAVRATFTP